MIGAVEEEVFAVAARMQAVGGEVFDGKGMFAAGDDEDAHAQWVGEPGLAVLGNAVG